MQNASRGILKTRSSLNPWLAAPWLNHKIFRMDWLHISDIGATADFIGNFFHEVSGFFRSSSKQEGCCSIYTRMHFLHGDSDAPDRFDCLIPPFFEPKDQPYRIRRNAAKIKALVPFVWQLAQEMLDINVPKHATLRQVAIHLHEMYCASSADHPTPRASMKERGLKFALQYVGLHDFVNAADDRAFRIKPKLHLLVHFTSDNNLPRPTWTCSAEDFGG